MGSVDMRSALRSFSGKRVFITGHTGFKGSWLTFLLKELGAEVPFTKSLEQTLKINADISRRFSGKPLVQ